MLQLKVDGHILHRNDYRDARVEADAPLHPLMKQRDLCAPVCAAVRCCGAWPRRVAVRCHALSVVRVMFPSLCEYLAGVRGSDLTSIADELATTTSLLDSRGEAVHAVRACMILAPVPLSTFRFSLLGM